MNEPYLFERGIGQQMGDLCRLAVGDAKVTQTGEIVTLEDMPGRGAFGVSVEVPYTSGGVQSVSVMRCGKNLANITDKIVWKPPIGKAFANTTKRIFQMGGYSGMLSVSNYYTNTNLIQSTGLGEINFTPESSSYGVAIPLGKIPSAPIHAYSPTSNARTGFIYYQEDGTYIGYSYDGTAEANGQPPENAVMTVLLVGSTIINQSVRISDIMVNFGTERQLFEPYVGSDTYTTPLPADFYGGKINLEAGTVTSRYAADGTELAEPVVTEIDPISIPILAGVNNVWADVGTVTVSYYAADAETFRPTLWYPTIYRGLTSARYLIKRASGAIASFDDAVAAPLVGLRVALPYDAEGYQSVSVTVNGTLTTITLPTTIYGGYLDVVTGQLVATHDADGNALANQKLYFLPPTNISALAGVNNVWSDAGDVAVSYRIDNG